MISRNFDEANFLFGIRGQTEDGMRKDIELGLANFERICINIMCANSTGIKPCKSVIKNSSAIYILSTRIMSGWIFLSIILILE